MRARTRLAGSTLLLALACAAPRSTPGAAAPLAGAPTARALAAEVAPARRRGTELVAAGRYFDIGTPVVLWSDPGGYDATGERLAFPEEAAAERPTGLRYRPGRVLPEGATRAQGLEELRANIDQFVLHYDACGTSRRCFRVLQDLRGLSVHFLLDLDGTLYQTLDLRETAWHARQSNARSIGVEIANVGAFAPGEGALLDEWYLPDGAGGTVLRIPPAARPSGLRSSDYGLRPARAQRVRGVVQGQELEQYDLTDAQYAALARLSAGLCRLFPAIRPDAPRDAQGRVRTTALDEPAWRAHRGLLGHLHVTDAKVDPGPAFDWERLLADVRAQLGLPAAGS